jgi:hypothetical protein
MGADQGCSPGSPTPRSASDVSYSCVKPCQFDVEMVYMYCFSMCALNLADFLILPDYA